MKRLFILIIVFILTAVLSVCFIISQDNTDKCSEHKDFNGDLRCDICNDEIALKHTTHEDNDGDNICDICDEKIESAQAPGNNVNPCPPCEACVDENEDGACDNCGKEVEKPETPDSPENPKLPCELCIDENQDGVCDNCGKEVEKPEIPDSPENPKLPCELCIDENQDGICDNCSLEITQKNYAVNSVTINGEDIKNHVIAYDSSDFENKLLAFKIQDFIFNNLGRSLNVLDCEELTNENYIAVKSAEKSGGVGFYVNIKDKSLEIICEFPNMTVCAGEDYFSSLFENPSETVALTEVTRNVRDICYKDFGAVGDGNENDFQAIKETHDYANQYGHSVIAERKATYYIGSAPESIIIRTSVNWFDSTFIIDDRNIASSDSLKAVSIFTVASDYGFRAFDSETDYIKDINKFGGLTSATERIDLGLGYPALLVIENSNHKNYIRYGEATDSAPHQKEIVIISKDGFVDDDTPIIHDYTEVTGITAYRIDDAPITLSGGTFIRKVNEGICDGSYYDRNISICRSNVTLEFLRYEISGESENPYLTNPYAAFLNIKNSNNVTVSNCTVMAHRISYLQNQNAKDTPLESCTLSASTSNNITWHNCFQSNFYTVDGVTPDTERSDIMSCEYSKNLTYENSTLSVFKANLGIYNISIVNCALSSIEAVGAGTMLIKNTYVYNNVLVKLTEEYGSYWNGTIIIKNSFMNSTNDLTLIGGSWYNHDFGYATCMPKDIIIDNLSASSSTLISIFDSRFSQNSNNILKDEIDGQQNLNKMLPTKNITIKNNTAGYIFFIPNTEYFNKTIITEE